MDEARDKALGATASPDNDEAAGLRFRLARDVRKRLDRYIADRIPNLSRARAQRLIEAQAVQVNGQRVKPSTILRQGDLVEMEAPPPRREGVTPQFLPLSILYEDDALIAVNKAPGVMVHPARSRLDGTLVAGLLWRFQEEANKGGALSSVGQAFARPGVIHRLDMNTSGVIIFAKRDDAHWRIARQFEERTVEKRYLALVEGEVEPRADVIEAPIGPHPNRAKGYREKMVVRQDQLGKAALTIYRALEVFEGFSLVEVEIKTGRTHQIRVHMSHIGYPLVGDDMYGGRSLFARDIEGRDGGEAGAPGTDENRVEPAPLLGRQALHAAALTFTHPLKDERMTISAPLPDDLRGAIERLRARRPGAGRTGIKGAALDLDALMVKPG